MKKAIVNLASYEPETFAALMGTHAADFTSLIDQTLKDPSLQNFDVKPQSESGAEGLGLSQVTTYRPPAPVCTYNALLRRAVCSSGSGAGISPKDTAITIVTFSAIGVVLGVASVVGGIVTAVKVANLRKEYSTKIEEENVKLKAASRNPVVMSLQAEYNRINDSSIPTKEAELKAVDDRLHATNEGKHLASTMDRIDSLEKESSTPGRITAAGLLLGVGLSVIGAGIYGVLSSYQGLQLADDEDYMTTVQGLWRAIQDLGPSKDCLHSAG
ncbi:MAG: hypothetical protein KA436_01015 [Oligoflexales bacterium]|nr:hypothetical protein [Oligoflexales bacterium]